MEERPPLVPLQGFLNKIKGPTSKRRWQLLSGRLLIGFSNPKDAIQGRGPTSVVLLSESMTIQPVMGAKDHRFRITELGGELKWTYVADSADEMSSWIARLRLQACLPFLWSDKDYDCGPFHMNLFPALINNRQRLMSVQEHIVAYERQDDPIPVDVFQLIPSASVTLMDQTTIEVRNSASGSVVWRIQTTPSECNHLLLVLQNLMNVKYDLRRPLPRRVKHGQQKGGRDSRQSENSGYPGSDLRSSMNETRSRRYTQHLQGNPADLFILPPAQNRIAASARSGSFNPHAVVAPSGSQSQYPGGGEAGGQYDSPVRPQQNHYGKDASTMVRPPPGQVYGQESTVIRVPSSSTPPPAQNNASWSQYGDPSAGSQYDAPVRNTGPIAPAQVIRAGGSPAPSSSAAVSTLRSSQSQAPPPPPPEEASPKPAGNASWIQMSELQILSELGSGAYGVVYKATFRGSRVAVKTLNPNASDEDKRRDAFQMEADLMLRIRPHPNVVQLIAVCLRPPAIVTELLTGGALDEHLIKNGRLGDHALYKIIAGIAAGMYHLHKEGIIHRDLASRNVLLDSSREVPKVCDFGMSRIVESEDGAGVSKSEVGPLRWMAPECFTDRMYSNKTDAWSFGVVIYEILSIAGRPYDDVDSSVEVAQRVMMFDLKCSAPAGISTELEYKMVELMQYCQEFDYQTRPDFAVIQEQLATLEAMAGLAPRPSPIKPAPSNAPAPAFVIPAGGGGAATPAPSTARVPPPVPSTPKAGMQPLSKFAPRSKNVDRQYKPTRDQVEPAMAVQGQVGWAGFVSREEAERMLKGYPEASFLTRWSDNASSYVVSYLTNSFGYEHIAYLTLQPRGSLLVLVDEEGSKKELEFPSLGAYIKAQQQRGFLSRPVVMSYATC